MLSASRAGLIAAAAFAAAGAGCAAGPDGPGVRLLRCGYRAAGGFQYLDTDVALAPHAPRHDPEAAVEPIRTYELYWEEASEGERVPRPMRLELHDGGSARPALAAGLRGLALDALRKSMAPPRRPLPWHFEALAGFLGCEPGLLTPAEREAILAHLREAEDPRPLALALYEHAARFAEASLEPLAEHEKVAVRLLPVVRRAALGDRGALSEVLRLSLEHHGELRAFERAVRALFPRERNAALYEKHLEDGGAEAAVALLREVASGLPSARHTGTGWALEG
ncbi:MAG: hypothetical protein HY721_25550 [Planctomycetes bacterium]|nr:hypothetical protein [Planctomycetota bacterium]